MLTEQEVVDSIPNLYDLSWWPKDDFNELRGFTMKSLMKTLRMLLRSLLIILARKQKEMFSRLGGSSLRSDSQI